ncbi:MAG: hypothetical protein Q8L55_02520 [Phycisphaerales bacterium]|nr:hypothetical protein [Phycisphaerales bacterium]
MHPRVALAVGIVGSLAASAHATIWTWQYTGVVTNVTNNGWYGFMPAVNTPITATISLDDTLSYVGNPGSQVNAFPSIASGLTLTIGGNTWSANNYGVFTQNQNFATNAQLAAQAATTSLYYNSVQQLAVGGPSMTLYTATLANVALTPFVFPDLTNPFDMASSGGYVSQYTAQSGAIYFNFQSVTLIAPAPGAGAGLVCLGGLLTARRRRA